jgi:hypothetical protein
MTQREAYELAKAISDVIAGHGGHAVATALVLVVSHVAMQGPDPMAAQAAFAERLRATVIKTMETRRP